MTLSKDDLALYDRQIRLWGLEAQQCIRQAIIMITGECLSGAAQECVKNLCLSGVQEIRLHVRGRQEGDAQNVLFGSYEPEEVIAQAQLLNPSVKLVCTEGDWQGVQVVVHVGSLPEGAFAVNEEARKRGIKSLWMRVGGGKGFLLVDLGSQHDYRYEQKRLVDKESGTFETLTHVGQVSFCPWEQAYRLHAERQPTEGKHRYSPVMAELATNPQHLIAEENAPVNAIMGALASQEVIKAVTGKDCPIVNVVCFDGDTLEARLFDLQQ